MVLSFGADESELNVAGGIMGRPVELTKAEFVSLPIPANAEFVIEGVLRQSDVMPEGPLGEFTGYYGRERSPQPVMEVLAVHHRKRPIFTHALMARYPSCEIGEYYAIMRSARILDDLERIGVPGVVAAYSHPAAASGWGMVVVSMQQKYAGHSARRSLRLRRNVRPPRTTRNGSSSWTMTSTQAISMMCFGR
jgi:UbiD family decarboxylase